MMMSHRISSLWLTFVYSFSFFISGSHAQLEAGSPCPCVPDDIVFRFDFQWKCDHPPSSSDFASSSYCSITGNPSNASIKRVVIHDLAATASSGEEEEELVELNIVEEQDSVTDRETGEQVLGATYKFTYHRSLRSPTVLWLDFYTSTRSSAKPVATIELDYSRNSVDCIDPHNPVFWAGDWIYFLTVERLTETRDPRCYSFADELTS